METFSTLSPVYLAHVLDARETRQPEIIDFESICSLSPTELENQFFPDFLKRSIQTFASMVQVAADGVFSVSVADGVVFHETDTFYFMIVGESSIQSTPTRLSFQEAAKQFPVFFHFPRFSVVSRPGWNDSNTQEWEPVGADFLVRCCDAYTTLHLRQTTEKKIQFRASTLFLPNWEVTFSHTLPSLLFI